jgi:hypothetical protein
MLGGKDKIIDKLFNIIFTEKMRCLWSQVAKFKGTDSLKKGSYGFLKFN